MSTVRRLAIPLLAAAAFAIAVAALVLGVIALVADGDRDGDGDGHDSDAALAPTPVAVAEEAAPPTSHPWAYTVHLVEEAIAMYEAEGLDATTAWYSSEESVDGPWYVFISRDGEILAHYDPAIRGGNHSDIPPDATGYDFSSVLAATGPEGRWVDYVFTNPDSGEQQRKHAYAVLHDGLIFGSGWYDHAGYSVPAAATIDEPAAFTQAYVADAIARYEEEGREAAFDYYSRPESAVDRWYLFVIDAEADELVLHPNPSLRGAETSTRLDRTGYAYGAAMLETTEDGQWVSYHYLTYDGETAVEQGRKHTWIVRRGGLLFGSGWYENVTPLPTKEDDPAGYTQWFVQDAIDVYDVRGLEGLLETYNDPASVDGDWYIFALDAEGALLAHPNAELRGQSALGPTGIDISGARFGPKLLEATEEGMWLTYYFRNPNGAECEFKHSWVVRRGEVIIGAGWYESAVSHPLLPSKCEPADYTVATVERALDRYRHEGREAAIAFHSSQESLDGRWYVFILEAASGTVLAHPANVYIGENLRAGPEAFDDAGYYYAGDLSQATAEGIFVRDVLGVPTIDEQNPFHTIEEVKHYYAVLEDGLIFVSGWYTTAPTTANPSEYARLLVGRALTRYDDEGLEATLAHLNDAASLDGPWYVFMIEDRGGVLYSVANANRPDIVGTSRERVDANGYDYGAAFLAVSEEAGGEWVSYLFTHPLTGEDAQKHTWIVRRGDLLFGAGWYEGIGEGGK